MEMAFINNGIGEQFEFSSPILVDGEIFKIVYDEIFSRVKNYLPLINNRTLGPILRKIKVVRCKNLNNLELVISVQEVDLEKGVISVILQFPFTGQPCDGEKVLRALREQIFLEDGKINGPGIAFKVLIPKDFSIVEISNGNNGRKRYIKG